jgi:hypothetical protein
LGETSLGVEAIKLPFQMYNIVARIIGVTSFAGPRPGLTLSSANQRLSEMEQGAVIQNEVYKSSGVYGEMPNVK